MSGDDTRLVAATQIDDQILALARSVTADDPVALELISDAIHALFMDGHMPEAVATAIAAGYQELSQGTAWLPVAVRSSSTAEDLQHRRPCRRARRGETL